MNFKWFSVIWENLLKKGNDKDFVLRLLEEEHVLLVHGSGFSQKYGQGYFRIVFLPSLEVLNEAFDRIEHFLLKHKK